MGILKNGIWGGISGKVGNRIYYMYKGKQVTRMVGRNVKPPTIKQLASQQGIKVVIDFLKPILSFIRVGFGVEANVRNKVAYHLAVGANKKYALKGEYPDIGIDYEKVVLSVGTLQDLTNASVSVTGNADGISLWFDWEVSAEEKEWPRCDDRVMLMAYFPEELEDNPACFKIAGAKRNMGQDVLELPLYVMGKPVEVYAAAISEDRTEVSDSQYLGRIEIG